MKFLKIQIYITMTLGVLSLIAGIFSHLALTDIGHGEPDLTVEWTVLRVSALLFLMFLLLTLATLKRVLNVLYLSSLPITSPMDE